MVARWRESQIRTRSPRWNIGRCRKTSSSFGKWRNEVSFEKRVTELSSLQEDRLYDAKRLSLAMESGSRLIGTAELKQSGSNAEECIVALRCFTDGLKSDHIPKVLSPRTTPSPLSPLGHISVKALSLARSNARLQLHTPRFSGLLAIIPSAPLVPPIFFLPSLFLYHSTFSPILRIGVLLHRSQ